MKFNLNYKVKVKLTARGKEIHRKNHDKLFPGDNPLVKYEPPKEDTEGWSEWQLWELMQEFGTHCYNGCNVPMETEIEIIENQEL